MLILTSRPAQAQGSGGWYAVQCDAQGNPTSSFFGTETGLATNTYPPVQVAADCFGFYPIVPDSTALADQFYDNTIGDHPPATCAEADNAYIDGYGHSGTYHAPDGSSSSVNGSVTVHWDGQVSAYYKEVWYGAEPPAVPMPDHIDFLLNTELHAYADTPYGSSGLTRGLSATSTVSDSQFNETVTASAGNAGAGSGVPDVVGHHLVRAAVDPSTGIAEVYLKGTVDWTASNSVPYMVPASGSTPPKFNGGTSALASGNIYVGIQQDNRALIISADVDVTSKKVPLLDANGNQTSDANGDPNYTTAPNARALDGTMYGDTIYSYHNYVTQPSPLTVSSSPDIVFSPIVVDTGTLNWIYFTPNFSGNWHYKSGTTHSGDSIVVPDVVDPDTWKWSPSESDDSWDYAPCSMPWAPNYTVTDAEPDGQNPPQTYLVTYSATDNTDQASASASYVMIVHDPLEYNYSDHVQHVVSNIRPAPDAPYARATYAGETLNVGVSQGNSWTISSTINCPIAMASWVSTVIGINLQISRQYSYAATVTLPVTGTYSYQGQTLTVQPGDETYMEEFDQQTRHYGKVDGWSTGGYTGTQPYDFSVPDNPSGGYQAHLPLIHSIVGQ